VRFLCENPSVAAELRYTCEDPLVVYLGSPKKVISPERSLVLPPVIDSDKYEALCVQLETVRLNGACALDLIQALIAAVNKLSDDVTQLISDNAALKNQVQDLQGLMAEQVKFPGQQPQGSSSARPAIHNKVMELRNVAPQQNSTRSYAEVVNFATQPRISTQAEDSQQSSADDRFIVVSGKHTKDRPANKVTNPVSVASKKSRKPMFGVRNTSSLPVNAKKAKRMSLFVSRFSSEVTAQDIEKSLEDQLQISSLTCTRLKTKFSTYASFHISVNEEDFPSINNTVVWPNGCLIAPFFLAA
jgi:hypothetical protein